MKTITKVILTMYLIGLGVYTAFFFPTQALNTGFKYNNHVNLFTTELGTWAEVNEMASVPGRTVTSYHVYNFKEYLITIFMAALLVAIGLILTSGKKKV